MTESWICEVSCTTIIWS